ncbi:hypothetical protein NM688_g8102 [Phlebia brevispora]|uniref:Uncharacterized protein n=1 Tax=Phlebia brevispora TaxID=194682 RepID=A0ACC1RXB5_9APHY|nr:hypothetical protein NM688_g8102 [Phlebia brevispora]
MVPSFNNILLTGAVLAYAVAPSFGQGLNITCFKSNGQKGNCTGFIDSFCTSISNTMVNPQDNVARCFTGSTFICDLMAWHAFEGSAQIDVPNCLSALSTVAATCVAGGTAFVQGNDSFAFTLDPNSGSCGDGSAIPH